MRGVGKDPDFSPFATVFGRNTDTDHVEGRENETDTWNIPTITCTTVAH